MILKEHLPTTEPVTGSSASAAGKTRRRPGRRHQVSPDLVTLLRSPTSADLGGPPPGQAAAELVEDELTAVKGIVVAVALSGVLWAGIGSALWAVLR